MSYENVKGYTDLVIVSAGIQIPSSQAPTAANWNGVKLYQYSSGDHMYFQGVQLPHGYVENTDLNFHVHFTTDTTIGNGQTVKWHLLYNWFNIWGVASSTVLVTATFTNNSTTRSEMAVGATSGTTVLANVHLIAGDCVIDGSQFNLSAVLNCDLYYDKDGTSTYAGSPLIVSGDSHYQLYRFGSFNQFTG